jgi:hypothetical protein
MAQTRKKRRRKHRGTQGGSIETRRRGRPRSREEARARARAGRQGAPRGDGPPTWRSAFTRGAIAAAIFAALMMLVFQRAIGPALLLAGFMLLFYIPACYYFDTMMWRRRERARIRAAAEKK